MIVRFLLNQNQVRVGHSSGSNKLDVITQDGTIFDKYVLEVQDDASSWREGDQIVIASTDFDMDQAETAKVLSVSDDGKKVTVEAEFQYVHYGDAYKGVEMYAEVGMYTRNVVIKGEMQPICDENDTLDDCEDLGYDNT